MYEQLYRGQKSLSKDQVDVLLTCRRNIINVFTHLSRFDAASTAKNAISIVHIRGTSSSVNSPSSQSDRSSADESASLLFFYIFDDWYSTYGLVARKEQQYSAELNNLVR